VLHTTATYSEINVISRWTFGSIVRVCSTLSTDRIDAACEAQYTVEYWTNWSQLNSTELGRSVQFSWVEFSFPLCIEPSTSGDDRRMFLTVKNVLRPSPVVAARRRFSFNDRRCIDWPIHENMPDRGEPATTANFVAESSQVVAGSVHSGKLNCTQQFRWVQFSSVRAYRLCCALLA